MKHLLRSSFSQQGGSPKIPLPQQGAGSPEAALGKQALYNGSHVQIL